MKFSLATKITVLAQALFLMAAVLIVLEIHFRAGELFDTASQNFYQNQIADVVNELKEKEKKLKTLPEPEQDLESFRQSALEHFRRIYYTDPIRKDYLFIVDTEGSVLLHPRLETGNRSLQSIFGPDTPGLEKGRTVMQGNDGIFQVFYARYPDWQWTICWAVPDTIQNETIRQLRTGMISILIVSLVIAGLALAYLVNVLVKPISSLTRVADSIARGDMTQLAHTDRQDEIGTLARAFVRMQDVIREKIDQLHRSEKQYRELVQQTNSIILRWDKDGRILYLNEYGRRLFGFSLEEITGRHVVGTIVAETETSSGRDLSAMIDDILLRPEAYILNENENICKDGSRVWIQWSNKAIVDDEGEFVEMLSVGINITERKKAEKLLEESENRFRSLFDSANDAILIRNEEGICIACNRKALELFGCSREQLIGHTPDAVSPERQPDGEKSSVKAKELIRKALEGETLSQEWQIRRFDNEICDVQATVSSFEANGLKFAQVVLTDITRQKRMEVELRQAQKMEGIGTLAGGIAHDFNNILSAIIGYTELAQMKVDQNSEIAKDLTQVHKASERASGLVRQILTFSRKQKHEDSALQINLIVKEALKLIRSSIPTTIAIEQQITTNAAVRTDPTLIHQLIMNLCTNAYQAMLEKGGKLTVAMHEVVLDSKDPQRETDLPDGKYVNIAISDTGYGMRQEIMSKIFDPFFTTKEQGRGTGLGLAVVYDIVKGLNGGITVLSEPGVGTTFTVLLPVAEEDEKTQGRETDQNLPAKGNERIMVVDDEPAICDLLQSILSSAGYKVDLFKNGEDAWLAFSKEPTMWSLIITDQTMPKMTGSQLATQALDIEPDIPVILCTGYSESMSVDKALELGIRAYLHKPVSLNELLATVHDVLKK